MFKSVQKKEDILFQIRLFLRKNFRYIAVLFIFLVTTLYRGISLPEEALEESKNSEESAEVVLPTLTANNREKLFSEIFQSKKSDIFRISFLAKVDYAQSVEILLRDSFSQDVKVGQVDLLPSEESKHQELVFIAPGRYESILLRLSEKKLEGMEWDNNAVYIESVELTRVDAKEADIKNIARTAYDVGGVKNTKLEDIGEVMRYTFSLLRDKSDYSSLFDHSEDIEFNPKNSMLTGLKKKESFLTFKFDVLSPYETFLFRAVRRGDSPDPIALEYSFNNESWNNIPINQSQLDGRQIFLLSIPNTAKASVVYIRVRYVGPEKKVGTYSLEELSVIAHVKKGLRN